MKGKEVQERLMVDTVFHPIEKRVYEKPLLEYLGPLHNQTQNSGADFTFTT